uniref:RING-CH-type domain-containing protein n=1 Tax=Macrostomum lignano TaxID=282301 RepID=A0A1I8HMF0_9PLAT
LAINSIQTAFLAGFRRQFSVKRVDETSVHPASNASADLVASADGPPAGSSASECGNFTSKSELLQSRRRQHQQRLQSQNAVSSNHQIATLGEDGCSCDDNQSPSVAFEEFDNDTVFCDDLCPLCDTCLKNSHGRTIGIQLDDNPGVIRWQKLPCHCPDRYLHISCLETGFYEDSVYKGGRRRLIISC